MTTSVLHILPRLLQTRSSVSKPLYKVSPVTMPTTYTQTLHFPLPPTLPAEVVVRSLHTYESLLRPNPAIQGFKRLQEGQDAGKEGTLADPFFAKEDEPPVMYEVRERVPIVPFLGWATVITNAVVFQRFAAGVRVRVRAAAGTTVTAVWKVREAEDEENKKEASDYIREEEAGPVVGQTKWELVETSSVECNVLLKPHIVGTFEGVHRDLGHKIIDYIARLGVSENHLGPT